MATEIRVKASYEIGILSVPKEINLELSKNEPITANYQFKDIQDVKSNRGNYTFNFRIPSTPKNNVFFNNYFDVTSYGNYDTRKKVEAEIVVNTFQVFSGYLQLTNVISSNGNISFYQCVVFNSVSSLGQIVDNKLLKDYDWSFYDHTITTSVVIQSMNRDVTPFKNGDIVYSLYDYGAGFLGTTPAYEGVNSPFSPINIRNLKPQMRLKTIWDKIIDDAGFTYESNFIDTEFAELYMDLNNGRSTISQGDQNYYVMNVAGNLSQTFTAETGVTEFITFSDTSWTDYLNEAGQYDPVTNILTPSSDWQNCIMWFSFRLRNVTNPGDLGNLDFFRIILFKEEVLNSGNFDYPEVTSTLYTGTLVQGGATQTVDVEWEMGAFNLDTTKRYKMAIECTSITQSDGDVIVFDAAYWNFYPQAINGQPYYVQWNNQQFDASVLFKTKYNFGEMKAIDFVTSLCKKFNLVIIPDRLTLTHLYIEPYSNWITQGEDLDWTEKLDKSKDIQYKPTTNLQAKLIKFQDGESSDLWNRWYLQQSGERYGTKVLQQDNDFGKKKDEVETIFAPTISRHIPDTTFVNAICYGENQEPVGGNRLSYYCGFNTSDNGELYYLTDSFNVTGYTAYAVFQNCKDAVPTSTSECISFESMPSNYAPYSVNGAFKTYWERFFLETYAVDSRLLIAHFYLNALDINTLNFNDIVFVNDSYYRINKITNYPLVGSGTCKVELIKVVENNPCGLEIAYISGNGAVYFYNTEDGSMVFPNQVSQDCCESFPFNEYIDPSGGTSYKCFNFQLGEQRPQANQAFDQNNIKGGNNGVLGTLNSVIGRNNNVTWMNNVTGSNNNIGNTSAKAVINGDNNIIGLDTIGASIKGNYNQIVPYYVSSDNSRLKLKSYASISNVNITGDYAVPLGSGDNVISGGADTLYNAKGRSASGHFVVTGWTDDQELIKIGQKGAFDLGSSSQSYYQSVIENAYRMTYPSIIGFELIVVGNNRGTSSARSQISSYRKYTGVIQNTNNSGNISAKNITLDIQKEDSEFANYSLSIIPVISAFIDNQYVGDGQFYFELETLGCPKLDNVDWTLDFKYSLVGLQNLSRTAGQKIFVPTSITGCLLWLDSADYSTFTFNSGTDISQWADKSGNNHHCTNVVSGAYPTYNDVIYNPYVQFGASNVALINQDSSLYDYSDSDNTIFVVFEADTSSDGGRYGHHIAGNSYRGRQTNGIFGEANSDYGGGGVGYVGYCNNSLDRSCDSNDIAPTTKQVVCGTFDGTNTCKFINSNGIQTTTTTGVTTSTKDQFAVGGGKFNSSSVTYEFDGKIYEVIVYDTELTEAQRVQVFNYLETKWNT